MNHDKNEVIPAAAGLWPKILQSLTNIDSKVFSGKHQPCPTCGGKDRFRYEKSYEYPFLCNQCGPRAPINFYMDLTGVDFSQAINDVGDYLNLIPVERRHAINQEFIATSQFPSWYEFDMKHYLKLKEQAYTGPTPWQRVSGLMMIDILAHGDDALIPLLNRDGHACDFVMVDIDGNWQTSGGNTIVPDGFYSTFGDEPGKRTYIAVNPYHAGHASVFTGKQVICCYSEENISSVANNFPYRECVVIVTSLSETLEADGLQLSQLTFNKQTKTVNRRLWLPGEIVKAKQVKGNE